MALLFGKEWDETTQGHYNSNSIIEYSNKEIGRFWLTTRSHRFIWKAENNYKIQALIYEKTLIGKPMLICLSEDMYILREWNNSDVSLLTIEDVLEDFPKDIVEIQERSLLNLYRKYPKYGQEIKTIGPVEFFVETDDELFFICSSMESKGLVKINLKETGNSGLLLLGGSRILENGWIEIENIIKSSNSKQAFIAMWFDSSMDLAFFNIKKALEEVGFSVMRIDRKQHNNEISGEILREINRSQLLIADVTHQRNGVYFESGYAMGRKIAIIWSCREDDLKNVHFDTRQYNHIVWKDEEDLYLRIKDRILGTIALR